MKLLVGLGNPGQEYENTLHNAGFRAIDALVAHLGLANWSNRFKGLIMKSSFQGTPFLLLKPQTYMNVSGESVVACKAYYKIEISNIIVLSDDLDLPLGTLRYREKGGHGGHNGLRNIIQLSGSNEFHRLKIGIGRPGKSSEKISNYVLNKPSHEAQEALGKSIEQSVKHQLDFILEKPIQVQSKMVSPSPTGKQ